MAKLSILIALVTSLVEVSGQSPCPQYFTYVTDPRTNEVMGQIEIPYPPRNVQLHLKVALSISAALSMGYVGQVELAYSKEDSVRAVQEGRSLLYYVHFPLRHPIPLLTGIWFNNEEYCSGPRAAGHIVTSIVLEHTLYPPNVLPLSHSSGPNNPPIFLPKPPPVPITMRPTMPPTTRPTIRPTTRLTTKRPKKKPTITTTQRTTTTVGLSEGIGHNIFLNPQNVCGISDRTNDINLLISMGMTTSPGEWPWLVALFLVRIEFQFQCAGSLLTNKHVITAAHCFKLNAKTNVNIPPSAMLASLGRYRLRDWHEPGSVNREIASYTIHPDYTHEATGDSDLAILILRKPVEFSHTIRPICMWSGSINLKYVVKKTGYVVGWGQDEFGNPHVTEPRMARVPIASQEECLWSDPRFVGFTSNRTLCAGLRDGSGPCNGDSGSGLVLHDDVTGRYKLRGIVSRSLYDRNELTCDLTQYVVYVDVAKYLSWIQRQISTT